MSTTKLWLSRLVAWVIITAALLRICQSWVSDGDATRIKKNYADNDGDGYIETRRCDACRMVAARFDIAFDLAEANLLVGTGRTRSELDESEVAEVVSAVCSKWSFAEAFALRWKDQPRLGGRGLETWSNLRNGLGQRNKETSPGQSEGPDWPTRLRNHCRFLAGKLDGPLVYEMWLRTSADVEDPFDHFLCQGEGVFADCARWTADEEKWPADMDYEDEEGDNGHEEASQSLPWFLKDFDLMMDRAAEEASGAVVARKGSFSTLLASMIIAIFVGNAVLI